MKASDTGGVKPMSIAGRFVRERERLLGMTDAERAWRRQWLKDQELSPNEPRYVPELHQELMSPIRKAYRAPLDLLAKKLEPVLGQNAYAFRYYLGKAFLGFYLGVGILYYFKHHQTTWYGKSGFYVIENRRTVVPGDPGYPKLSDKSKPEDYASQGFKECTLNL